MITDNRRPSDVTEKKAENPKIRTTKARKIRCRQAVASLLCFF